MDLDSTAALLSSNLPVGGDPRSAKKKKADKCKEKKESPPTDSKSAFVDSEEDEIFFGEKTDKELYGKNAKETLHLGMLNANKRQGSLDTAITPQPKLDKIWTQYRNAKDYSIEEESVASVKENEENVDPKSPAKVVDKVLPSPRKINMDKVEPCDRKYRSRSPLKMEDLKTPPRRILNSKPEDDVDTSKENSIIDVDNDQMFENSIFTEYDDNNLSCMSAKMTKKWRKKWEKEDTTKNTFSTNTIEKLVAKQEQIEKNETFTKEVNLRKKWEKDDDKKTFSIEETEEVNEADNEINASTCSEWFNTTRDEMILYEKFGEDYDEIVNKMSHEERVKLKEEIEGADKKPECPVPQEVVVSAPTPPPPVPKPRTLTPVKADIVPRTLTPLKADNVARALSPLKADIAHHHGNTLTAKYFKSPRSLQATPNYLRPTTASKMRTSPRKTPNSPKFNLDVTPCPRNFVATPSSAPKHRSLKKVGANNIDLNKVISPVGQYIRSNPAPPLIRQIRPKATKHFDDELAAFEREEQFCHQEVEKKRMFKPLPMAEYKSSLVALEQPVQSGNDEPKPLPKVFGVSPTVEAKIIRHVGRERIRNDPGKPITLATLDETNTMEMSIRQVVEQKKMTAASRAGKK